LILSKKVVLSAKDSPENWMEISEEEGDALRRKELKEQGLLSEDEEFVG
jgi:hypothetical protein